MECVVKKLCENIADYVGVLTPHLIVDEVDAPPRWNVWNRVSINIHNNIKFHLELELIYSLNDRNFKKVTLNQLEDAWGYCNG